MINSVQGRRTDGWGLNVAIGTFCAMLLPPVFAAVLSACLSKRNPFAAAACIVVAAAAISAFYIPIGDQTDYYLLMQTWRDVGYSFSDFIADSGMRERNLVHCSLFFLAKLGLTLEMFRALLVAVSMTLGLSIIHSVLGMSGAGGTRQVLSSLMVLTSLPLFWVCTGFRYGMATILFVWGVVAIEVKDKSVLGWIALAIGAAVHYSMILFCAVFIMCRTEFFDALYSGRKRWAATCLVACGLSIGGNVTFGMLQNLMDGSGVGQVISTYLSGDAYFNSEFLEDMSDNTRLFYVLYGYVLFAVCPVIWSGWSAMRTNAPTVCGFIGTMLVAGFFMASNLTVLNRLIVVTMPLVAVAFILSLKDAVGFPALRFMCVAMLCAFVGLFPVLRMKKALARSDIRQALYKPSMSCLMHTYDEDWVAENIENRSLVE